MSQADTKPATETPGKPDRDTFELFEAWVAKASTRWVREKV